MGVVVLRRSFKLLALMICLFLSVMSSTSYCGDDQVLEREREKIRPLVNEAITLRADWMEIHVYDRWAFVDAAEKDFDGNWSASTSVLLLKSDDEWKVVATGDPMDESWQVYYNQMPSEVKKAYDEWIWSHI
jgi:hypothetical protein